MQVSFLLDENIAASLADKAGHDVERVVNVSELGEGVDEDGRYDAGHYFGEFSVPDDDSDGDLKKTGEIESHDVVEWTGETEKIEYWECDDCFFRAS
jgi:hypothetical protein